MCPKKQKCVLLATPYWPAVVQRNVPKHQTFHMDVWLLNSSAVAIRLFCRSSLPLLNFPCVMPCRVGGGGMFTQMEHCFNKHERHRFQSRVGKPFD